MTDIDFEGTAQTQPGAGAANATQEDVTPLDGKKEVEDINSKTTGVEGNPDTDQEKEEEGNDTGLNAGDNIQFEDNTYTVAENGDLLDKDGKVFKAAAEVKAWMDSLDKEEDTTFDINTIREGVGIDVTDENGNPVEFSNDVEGIKSYINSVIEIKTNEATEGAINKLYNDNPLLKQFVDYVQVNGSPRGFGDIPDRSKIVLNKDNERQLEAVVRMAAKEFGNKSINDAYIKYLKDSGNLYNVAKEQLDALVVKDQNYKVAVARQAEAQRQAEQDAVVQYWQNVSDVINNGIIDGYKLPETFMREVNGKKITETRNDFYNYLSKQSVVDANGNRMTKYQKDLQDLTDEQLLNRELLDAYLLWRGGSYKDLVDLKVNEEKAKTLRLVSKERKNSKTIKVVKTQPEKVNLNDIVL